MQLQIFNSKDTSITAVSQLDHQEYMLLPNVVTSMPFGPFTINGKPYSPSSARLLIKGNKLCSYGSVFCRAAEAFAGSADKLDLETAQIEPNTAKTLPVSQTSIVLVIVILLMCAIVAVADVALVLI